MDEETRLDKIKQLKWWINQDSPDGYIDAYYIGKAEELCEELGITWDEAIAKYIDQSSKYDDAPLA